MGIISKFHAFWGLDEIIYVRDSAESNYLINAAVIVNSCFLCGDVIDGARVGIFWLWRVGPTHENYLPWRITSVRWVSCRDEAPVSQRSPKPLFSQALVHQNPGFFTCWHIWLRGGPAPPLRTAYTYFLLFFSVSGEAFHEYSLPPVITLEVSKTSLHLRWCRRVGSGTQACSQVLLAAAAGFPGWSVLGAKVRTLFQQHLSRVQGYREVGSLKQTVWGSLT